MPDCEATPENFPSEYNCERKIAQDIDDKKMLNDVAEDKITLDEFIAQVTDEEMMSLLLGIKCTGVANIDGFGDLSEYGIPEKSLH